MITKKCPVVHFEFPAENKQRMTDFYNKVFGWETEMMGEEMNGYVAVTTTEVDKKTGRPATPGAINGGFYQKELGMPAKGPSVVIAVDDVKSKIEEIKQTGGEIVNGPDDVPGVGVYASFKDTEGNIISMLQPMSEMSVHS